MKYTLLTYQLLQVNSFSIFFSPKRSLRKIRCLHKYNFLKLDFDSNEARFQIIKMFDLNELIILQGKIFLGRRVRYNSFNSMLSSFGQDDCMGGLPGKVSEELVT